MQEAVATLFMVLYFGTTFNKREPEDMGWAGRQGASGHYVLERLNPVTGKQEHVPIPELRKQFGFRSFLVYRSPLQV